MSPTPHDHDWFTEQQTGHRFCNACGFHDPEDPNCPDRPSALYVMLSDPEFPAVIRRIGESMNAEYRTRRP